MNVTKIYPAPYVVQDMPIVYSDNLILNQVRDQELCIIPLPREVTPERR